MRYADNYYENDDYEDDESEYEHDDYDCEQTWGQENGICERFGGCFECPYVDECF